MAETKKPVAVAKKVEAKKVEAKKVEAVVEKKVEAVAAKPVEKKVAAKKTTAAKKPAAAKKAEPAKKATAAKKTAVSTKVMVQFDDREVDLEGLVARAAEAYKAAGHKTAAKDIKVYVNVNEKMVYYVADDYAGSFEA